MRTYKYLRGTGASVLALAIMSSLALTTEATADITGFTLTSSEEIGPFRGKAYRRIAGVLEGIAPGGPYSVPIELAFPISEADFNGFALVDVVAMNVVDSPPELWPPAGGRLVPVREYYSDDYLYGNGNLYVSVLWHKEYVEYLGVGVIAADGDEYEIWRDVAALARDPEILALPADIEPPRAANQVIVSGYSATATRLLSFFHFGLNQAEGAPVFDGAILGVPPVDNLTPGCRNRATGERAPCDPTRTDGAKIINIWSEAEVENRGGALRGETADYRHIEVPGVAHLTPPCCDWRPFGYPEQNPISIDPVFRGAMTMMQAWLEGTSPPPSLYVDIPLEPTRMVADLPYWDAVRDADGNALGGLRLPHVEAPLGEYHGYNEAGSPRFRQQGGYWVPFAPEQIRARYPTREAYVAAVRAAADALVADRYILAEDRDAYVAEAEAALFWN